MFINKIYHIPKDNNKKQTQTKKSKKIKDDEPLLENRVDTFDFASNKIKNEYNFLDLKKMVYSQVKEQLIQLSLIEAIKYHLGKILEINKEKAEQAIQENKEWEPAEVAKRIVVYAEETRIKNNVNISDLRTTIIDGFNLAVKGWDDKSENKELNNEIIENIHNTLNTTLNITLHTLSK